MSSLGSYSYFRDNLPYSIYTIRFGNVSFPIYGVIYTSSGEVVPSFEEFINRLRESSPYLVNPLLNLLERHVPHLARLYGMGVPLPTIIYLEVFPSSIIVLAYPENLQGSDLGSVYGGYVLSSEIKRIVPISRASLSFEVENEGNIRRLYLPMNMWERIVQYLINVQPLENELINTLTSNVPILSISSLPIGQLYKLSLPSPSNEDYSPDVYFLGTGNLLGLVAMPNSNMGVMFLPVVSRSRRLSFPLRVILPYGRTIGEFIDLLRTVREIFKILNIDVSNLPITTRRLVRLLETSSFPQYEDLYIIFPFYGSAMRDIVEASPIFRRIMEEIGKITISRILRELSKIARSHINKSEAVDHWGITIPSEYEVGGEEISEEELEEKLKQEEEEMMKNLLTRSLRSLELSLSDIPNFNRFKKVEVESGGEDKAIVRLYYYEPSVEFGQYVPLLIHGFNIYSTTEPESDEIYSIVRTLLRSIYLPSILLLPKKKPIEEAVREVANILLKESPIV